MPSNIRQLKRDIRKAIKKPPGRDATESPGAQIQQIVATILLKNLARFTPVDTGELAGGWNLNTRKGARGGAVTLNQSRRISLKNLDKIDKLTGKSDISITNDVEHGVYLNFGTATIRARAFVQMALAATRRELNALKIPIRIKTG